MPCPGKPQDLRSDDGRILFVDVLIEVAHGLVLGDGALAVLSPVRLQTLVEQLVIDGVVFELDVLGKVAEQCDVVLAAEELAAVGRILRNGLVDLLVVGELRLVLDQVRADLFIVDEGCLLYTSRCV